MNPEHVSQELKAEQLRGELAKQICEEARRRIHHPFSASKLQALEACPSFDGADSENEASMAGTLQHHAMDTGDERCLDDYQKTIVASLRAYKDASIAAFETAHGKGCTVLKEEYVIVDDDVPVPGVKGTSGGYFDLAIIDAMELNAHIWDWKFGKWAVEPAETNLQGYVYALGLRRRFPLLESITVEFDMPYLKSGDSHTFKAPDFPRLYARVKHAVAAAVESRKKPLAERQLVAKDLACCFCAHLANCPAIGKLVLNISAKYAPLQVPASVLPSVISDPRQASLGMKLARLMTAWGKGYSSQCALKAAEDPAFMPEGFELKQRADRKIVDMAKFDGALLALGISAGQLQAAKTLTLTAAGTLVRATAARGAKDDTEKAFFEAAEKAKIIGREDTVTFLQAKREKLDE
jgi:hypothetical protein